LAGVEGRLFGPIAIATIISMVASFLVSLTVIPVLCSLVLKNPGKVENPDSRQLAETGGWLVRGLKWLLKNTLLRLSLDHPLLVLGGVACMLLAAASLYPMMGRDFLPSFHEETVIITTGAAPGTAMGEMEQLSAAIETKLRQVPEVHRIGRRIGRAERSDHIVPISNVEFDVDFKPSVAGRSREEVLKDIRTRVQQVPGSFSAVAGPLSHRISHMLSGVTSPVAIKIFGPELEQTREIGVQVQELARSIPGLEDAKLDQQASIPQLRIEVNRERAHAHGVTPGSINQTLASLLGGETITQLRDGPRTIDLAIRLPEAWRENPARFKELPIETLSGRRIPLGLVADIREAQGPNAISRENTQRRFIVAIKPTRSDAGELVAKLQRQVTERIKLPTGVYISYEGDFQAERAATRRIGLLFAGVLGIITLLLWRFFRSISLALQVLVNLPLALMGSLVLTWLLIGNISIATLVGLIAVGGVAARNGIMMLSHYLHLMHHEGEGFTRSMIERGTLERLVPVTMTALAAGIALVPLMLAAGEPGKEILHPVAVCIVGGLVTSTLVGFAITPALFRLFGRKAALRSLEASASI
jgi:Cu/Ag efflux pump CusA